MRELEHRVLGERFVYPGHPATLALLILEAYPDIDDALAKGADFPRALESPHIPGAGGNVYSGLDVIQRARTVGPEKAVEYANDVWAQCDEQRRRNPERWAQGQAQADRIKPTLLERLRRMVEK